MHTRQRRALFALGCFFVMGGLGMTVSGDNSRDKQVHALISQHASGNQGRMNDAIRKLNGFGEGAVPALIDALADEDASVRRNAAWALGRMGEPAKAAAPILIEMLTDEDASVRARAVGALRQMGEPAGMS